MVVRITFGNGREGIVFYDRDLPTALEQAKEYAGEQGSAATVLDIVQARILAPGDSFVWNNFFTTTTGEYKGLSKQGNPVYVTAHGIGPLKEPARIRQAYKEDLVNGAARLEQKEFYDLLEQEDNKKVIVQDFNEVKKFKSGVTSVESARDNALVRARFGEYTDTYLDKHKEIYRDEVSNLHHCNNGRDLKVPQGRLLFVDDSGSNGFYGDSNLDNVGRFWGVRPGAQISTGKESIKQPSLEEVLKALKADLFQKGLEKI